MALVVVSGAIANKLHQGGEAWVRLSYLLGLRRLGYHVHFLEQIAPQTCVSRDGVMTSFESSANREYFTSVMDEFGLSNCSTLLPTDRHGGTTVTPELKELADSASCLLNISGHLAIEPLLMRFRNKVFIDIDPGYTQYWHTMGTAGVRLSGHDWYFTIGENIGSLDCPIPTNGIRWQTTRPPVVLNEWPVAQVTSPLRFTTVANWRGSYGVVQFGDQTFGLKVHEFRKMFELPQRVAAQFEIALNIHPGDQKDLMALQEHDWKITDPLAAASTPARFRRYVQQSGAEFSVAQGIYVTTNSGWFSDRTVRYLASGKPVLVQNTGFSSNIPTGQGIIPFRTLDDAVRGSESIASDYAGHCAAARAIAEEYFDSDRVLDRLMDQVGIAA
jgi:hypothetical protein